MYNFIVCDDNKHILALVCNIIHTTLKEKNVYYEIYCYSDYNNSFMEMINNQISNKIFFLDIETPTTSGIDIARIIRKVDYDSILIFLTAHKEYANTILKEEFSILTFICKKEKDLKRRIQSAINKAIKYKRGNLLLITNHIQYSIPMKDILYVTTDERKSVVVTSYTQFKFNESLTSIIDMLDDRFIQTYISCYINLDNISYIDYKLNKIVFKNKEEIYMLSRKYKKELKERLNKKD